MSESILEITDTSLTDDVLSELKDNEIVTATPAIIETTINTKRQLEDDDENERSAKKVCSSEVEGEEANVSELAMDETKVDDPEELNLLEQNISENLPEEVLEKTSETIEDEDVLEELPSQEIEDEEEEIGEESFECQDEEEEEIDEEEEASSDDDAELMARALQSANVVKPPKKIIQMTNDEPIDLDDSDEDEEENINETSNYKSDSDEFSVDNNVVGESDEEAEEIKEMLRFKSIRAANKVNLMMAKRIVKKCRNVFLRKKVERVKPYVENEEKTADETEETVEKPVEDAVEPMEVTEEKEKQGELLPLEPLKPQTPPESLTEIKPAVFTVSHSLSEPKITEENLPDAPEKTIDSTPLIAVPALAEVTTSLLVEIQNAPIEEIFSRYVLKTSESSPTLDEFNEELFFCLQQNKLEIEKATQLWNEKLHVKYKIRELLETIRRHRAVMEIETFGKVPDNSCSNNNNHPVISSKSSTTTNSETDHYEKQLRMTSDSVSRLIQDVRASMLKRDEKQDESFNSVQQGRQGQIIDVQSIINDFRQKNPQEIPRRGRRMKGSFGYENQSSLDYSSNGHEFNSTAKSSGSGSGGYPEVSLHPVHNLYKNLGNVQAGPHFSGGQRSSLLQSILTKQSTKSPASGFHTNQSLPSTSTLARLLTAPERSIHSSTKQNTMPPARRSSTKVHNNGEITITPIGLNNNSARNKDFSMEDEDNSMEPPLVIDETEDFDTSGKSVTDLLCQGCKKNKAFFMCAGCSRQWYCSKECQEMAWDEHAEDCMI